MSELEPDIKKITIEGKTTIKKETGPQPEVEQTMSASISITKQQLLLVGPPVDLSISKVDVGVTVVLETPGSVAEKLKFAGTLFGALEKAAGQTVDLKGHYSDFFDSLDKSTKKDSK